MYFSAELQAQLRLNGLDGLIPELNQALNQNEAGQDRNRPAQANAPAGAAQVGAVPAAGFGLIAFISQNFKNQKPPDKHDDFFSLKINIIQNLYRALNILSL